MASFPQASPPTLLYHYKRIYLQFSFFYKRVLERRSEVRRVGRCMYRVRNTSEVLTKFQPQCLQETITWIIGHIILLKTKRRLLYLRPSPYRAVNTFHLGYKNQTVYAVKGTSRCLFSDKYKTHKYSVGRAYNY